MSGMFTLDEEKVEKRSTAATVKIVRNDEAELLQWTDTKLGRCKGALGSFNKSSANFLFLLLSAESLASSGESSGTS